MSSAWIVNVQEGGTPAMYHAQPNVLALLDRIQDNFLDEVGLSAESGLHDYSLAPLSARRDTAMLGVLFKSARGIAPPPVRTLFPLE